MYVLYGILHLCLNYTLIYFLDYKFGFKLDPKSMLLSAVVINIYSTEFRTQDTLKKIKAIKAKLEMDKK
ncbi:hypothetical protein AYJ09_01510 [Candidatus Liberibacter solanacearum]|nr:hypothetical protein AYJ09_01510 [Candidatus Liberibacter solanacearum]